MNGATAYADEDVGNIVLLEHINVSVPDQALATLFYVVGLGLTRDPYLTVGLDNMWVNAGEQQFHLPTRDAQVIPGHIGIVVPDLGLLRERLASLHGRLKGTRFAWSEAEGCLEVICPWGNHFRCYAPGARFGDMALGIPYVEFKVKPGSAGGIARFYEEAMRAPCLLESRGKGSAARIEIGRYQWLLFLEVDEEIPPYDGHHIAVYVANFSGPHHFLKRRDLIIEDVRNHQFRFKDIVDPSSGAVLFMLEHEVRSLRHPMYHRSFINRDPTQSQRNYHRGQDALIPFRR